MTETLMPAPEPELRSTFVAHVDRVEVRESGEGNGDYTLTGHAAVFDKWSEDLWTFGGTFREKIAPGAFADVLASKPDVRLLYNHDGLTLARTKSGTLELTEDEEGLRVWARLAPTSTATDLRMAMQRGDIDQMSFAFTIAEDEWHEDHESDEIERVVLRVGELFDVSVVSFPAYPDTDAVMRELRSAAAAGKIHPVAEAETDPPGDAPSGDSETAAPAETDPVDEEEDPLAALRTLTSETVQRERESYLRLLKELVR